MTTQKKALQERIEALRDQGKIIESEFADFRLQTVAAEISPQHLGDIRYAFMAGSLFMFASFLHAITRDTGAKEWVEKMHSEFDEMRKDFSQDQVDKILVKENHPDRVK